MQGLVSHRFGGGITRFGGVNVADGGICEGAVTTDGPVALFRSGGTSRAIAVLSEVNNTPHVVLPHVILLPDAS